MSIYIPYTYLIGWSSLNKYYYGVRFAKGCNPSDLWVKYFTSSKIVKDFREKNGDPDIIQIRKTFKTSYQAILWESKVLRRLNVRYNHRMLNAASISEHWVLNCGVPANKGKSMTEEQKSKISLSCIGRIPANKGKPSPKSADNARKGAAKVRDKALGRKRKYLPDGSWIWFKPTEVEPVG